MQVVGPWEPPRESARRRTTGRQGRTAEMKELAGEMLPIFQAADVHREALAALAVFQPAAAR